MMRARTRPALAATYEGNDPALLERLVSRVGYIELSPDSISVAGDGSPRLDPNILGELKDAASSTKFVVHGVGLSIASADTWSEDYLRLLDGLVEAVPIAWHSEHLGYTTVEGEHLGTMLAPPLTEEALDLVSERASRLRSRYGLPFLLEHIVSFMPMPEPHYSLAAFMNALARNAACGFIVDAYNLECDAANLGFDVAAFLTELDLGNVREIHLAGGVVHRGFHLDVHSRAVTASTKSLGQDILARCPNVAAVTYEFLKEAVPWLGRETICAVLDDLRSLVP